MGSVAIPNAAVAVAAADKCRNDQAIQLKVPVIWMQEEVVHEQAAEKARKHGIFVVMDRCILQEHRARFR